MTRATKRDEMKKLTEKEIRQWFEELIRISTEAEERFNKGDVIPALSSLAAIPPLHSTLMENCVNATKESNEIPTQTEKPGLYL